MTTTTAQPANSHRSSFARVPAAFRLQFAVPYSFIWLPMFIFVLAWALGAGIGFFIDSQMPDRIAAQEPLNSTGASQATIWYLAFMAAYTASHTFPFSLALSYSRRVYLMGTYLTFLAVSLGYGVAAMLAYYIERLTDGFGRHIYVFGSPVFEDYGGGVGVGAMYTVVVLFFMCFGFFWAILYRRVSILILWAVIIGVVIALLGAVVLITQNAWWGNIGMWFVDQNAFSLAGWGLLAVIALGGVNYLLIRKATAG
ncbi:MAG TPA: hypothetical protein K8V32_03165 [Enteractinococcus helveticum]|uniref:Uncharacterized protein n=1 Tax=Enteractinococcus helveticum TaxID=1837282 RepID=A0A921K754_9MICC|nr:hypothetical protein [Enteractinococcus helveticum]HJF13791.1 hypothetical protein [Enteractinococcus helveticum]